MVSQEIPAQGSFLVAQLLFFIWLIIFLFKENKFPTYSYIGLTFSFGAGIS